MKKFKYFIIILFILIIILSIFLVMYIKKQNTEETQIDNMVLKETLDIEDTKEYNKVKDTSKLFNVINYINKYFDVININNSAYYGRGDNGEEIQVVSNEEIKSNIYQLLASDYIENNNITEENVTEFIPKVNKKLLFVPTDMEVLKKEKNEKYIISGFVEDIDYNYISDIYIILNLDIENNVYSIEPTNNKYKSIEELENKTNVIEVEKNTNNNFEEIEINEQYICTQYIYLYKRTALANIEKSYENLDKEYREKRFGTIDNYKRYIEDNKNEIEKLTLNKFLKDENKYICKDKNDNTYTFTIGNNLLEYKIKLDTYTIPSEDIINKYNSSSDENKVALNVDKLIKMINSRDYQNLYLLLDEEFRNNKFKDEEGFINYMNTTMVYNKYYKYNTSNISKEGDVYILTINLSDITEQEDFSQEFKVMMLLEENMEFKISFTTI